MPAMSRLRAMTLKLGAAVVVRAVAVDRVAGAPVECGPAAPEATAAEAEPVVRVL